MSDTQKTPGKGDVGGGPEKMEVEEVGVFSSLFLRMFCIICWSFIVVNVPSQYIQVLSGNRRCAAAVTVLEKCCGVERM